MTPDSESSPATATAAELQGRDAAPLQPELTHPSDVAPSRWRRSIAGLLDFVVALIVGASAGAVVSNTVELGTTTSASVVVIVGWLGVVAYLASPWTLARRALGMRIIDIGAKRGARLIRGLVRVLLLPVNLVMVLAVNRHVGDMITTARTVRARVSWLCIALVPIVIVIGYAGATRLFLHAATLSDAWTKARQVVASEIELQQFVLGDGAAVFESSWGHQELVQLGRTWHVIGAQQRTDSEGSLTVGISLKLNSLSIAGSGVTRVKLIDVTEVRAELMAKLAQQVDSRGMALRDVECDDITGPTNECRAHVTKPGEDAIAVRIAIRLDDKEGMVGKISALK